MHRHPRAECRHFLGKFVPCLRAQLLSPMPQRLLDGLVQTANLFHFQSLRQCNRRQPRVVEYFVRIRVADSAEQMWVRQRALQCVIFRNQIAANCSTFAANTSIPPASSPASSFFSRQNVQRSPLLRPSLRERQRPVFKIERPLTRAFHPESPALLSNATDPQSSSGTTSQISLSNPMAIRFPILRNSLTFRP